jgi:hypothetical protein
MSTMRRMLRGNARPGFKIALALLGLGLVVLFIVSAVLQ